MNLPSVFNIIRPTIWTLIALVLDVNSSFGPRFWPSHVVILRDSPALDWDSPAVIGAPSSRTVANS